MNAPRLILLSGVWRPTFKRCESTAAHRRAAKKYKQNNREVYRECDRLLRLVERDGLL